MCWSHRAVKTFNTFVEVFCDLRRLFHQVPVFGHTVVSGGQQLFGDPVFFISDDLGQLIETAREGGEHRTRSAAVGFGEALRHCRRKAYGQIRDDHTQGPRFEGVPVREERGGLHIGFQFGFPLHVHEELEDTGTLHLPQLLLGTHKERVVQRAGGFSL